MSKKKIAVLVGGIVLVIVLIFIMLPHRQPLVLPQSILHLRLTEEIRGTQAQKIINGMYKNSVRPEESVIGIYFSTDGCAKLYVSFYDSRAIAEKQLKDVIDLLRLEKSVYSHFQEFQIKSEKVYMCFGNGQSYYFFLHEKKLYCWIADTQIAQASMQELVRTVINNTQR
jgi:hypothetical protein